MRANLILSTHTDAAGIVTAWTGIPLRHPGLLARGILLVTDVLASAIIPICQEDGRGRLFTVSFDPAGKNHSVRANLMLSTHTDAAGSA